MSSFYLKDVPLVLPLVQVLSIDHITLVVKNLEATRKFYVDLLGMREVARPRFSFDGQWFQAGATLVHTILEHDESGPAGSGKAERSRGHHFAFLVDDALKAAELISATGWPLVTPAKSRPDGAIQVFLQDPDGYLIELTSPPVSPTAGN